MENEITDLRLAATRLRAGAGGVTEAMVTDAQHPMDVGAIRSHAKRVFARMCATPHGPKRKRLAEQHVNLTNQALRAEGFNAAMQAKNPAGGE